MVEVILFKTFITTSVANGSSPNSDDGECEDPLISTSLYEKIIVITLLVISIVGGLGLNGAAVFLFAINWKRLSKHMINWLIFNIAASNFATIVCSSVTLLIEEFQLTRDWRLIEKIFLSSTRAGTDSWTVSLLMVQNVTFDVSMYSLFALSIERWMIISGRRRKMCRFELSWTGLTLALIWIGSIVHAYSRIPLIHVRWGAYYQVATDILITGLIPCLGIGCFFAASARWLLYSYGASDDFSVKNLKARTRTARYLLIYVLIVPLCIFIFILVFVLFQASVTRTFLQCDAFGQFLTHMAFLIDNCLLQCLHPSLLFMLSSRYRQCAYNFWERMRDCAYPNSAETSSRSG